MKDFLNGLSERLLSWNVILGLALLAIGAVLAFSAEFLSGKTKLNPRFIQLLGLFVVVVGFIFVMIVGF